MTVGFPLTKDQLDTRLGQIALQVRDGLEEAQQLNALLGTLTTEVLEGLGYDETNDGEVSTMKSAFTQLAQLADVANGDATVTNMNDFLFWAKRLLGVYG